MSTCSADGVMQVCPANCGCYVIASTKKEEDDEAPFVVSGCDCPHDAPTPKDVRFTIFGPRSELSEDQVLKWDLSTEVDIQDTRIELIGSVIERVLAHKYRCAIPVVKMGDKVDLSMTASIGDVLDRMEGKGWILRQSTPNDRRIKLLELSPLGHAVLQQVEPGIRRVQERLLAGLTGAEAKTLVRLLAKMADGTEDDGGND